MAKKKKNKDVKQNVIEFWQGKITLGKSFWLVFVVGGSIMTIPSFILTDAYVDSLDNLGLILFITFFIFQYTYLIVAYVGTWRSAKNYKPKKNQWAWGNIAKIYIVLNLIRGAVSLFA
tara:strand:- start:69 stop:422 length:354 start_codon:yes stop_codon:yes gene_type:complete